MIPYKDISFRERALIETDSEYLRSYVAGHDIIDSQSYKRQKALHKHLREYVRDLILHGYPKDLSAYLIMHVFSVSRYVAELYYSVISMEDDESS